MGYNVFAELGFENPEKELLKCHLVRAIRNTLAEKRLANDAVSALRNVAASEIHRHLQGDWEDYSVGQLYQFKDALNRDVNAHRLIVNQVAAPA